MYKLIKSPFDDEIRTVNKQDGNLLISIPFDLANTDYQKFKKDIMAGGELQDAEGNPMSQEAAIEFVRGLP